jgi:hypothetical protein
MKNQKDATGKRGWLATRGREEEKAFAVWWTNKLCEIFIAEFG